MGNVSFDLRPGLGKVKPDPNRTQFPEGTALAGKLYKYLAPGLADKALTQSGAMLKFSMPTEFNDPFELFLTVDHDSPPATLAFYEEVIGDIELLPTTCFSRRPDVVPMWAHYGQNGRGFAIEVDEDGLRGELGWAAPVVRSGLCVSRRFPFRGCSGEHSRRGLGSPGPSGVARCCTRPSSR